MADRQVSLLLADDLLWSMNGKVTMIGIYGGDITIQADSMAVPQLVFLFSAETDITDPFQLFTLHIQLAGEIPVIVPIPMGSPPGTLDAQRTRWIVRWPYLLSQATLRPGRIVAKIIHEKGELVATAPWIVRAPAFAKPS
jgi:hypothetical protein